MTIGGPLGQRVRTIGLEPKTIIVFVSCWIVCRHLVVDNEWRPQPCLFTHSQVSLIALGPLTNLALAVRLDHTLPQKLKDLYIMGGNMEGKEMSCSTKTGHLKWMAANCTFHISDYILHKKTRQCQEQHRSGHVLQSGRFLQSFIWPLFIFQAREIWHHLPSLILVWMLNQLI